MPSEWLKGAMVWPRTLRTRLVLLTLVVFGSIQAVLAGLTYFTRERYIRVEFDDRLRDGVEAIAETIELVEGAQLGARGRPYVSPLHFVEFFFAIRAPDGSLLERSRNLGDRELPFGEKERRLRPNQAGRFVTLTDGDWTVLGKGYSLRQLTVYRDPPETDPFYLQVAISVEPVEERLRSLQRLILSIVPAGLVLAAGASYLLVKRMLAPIGRVVREARRITAADLSRRLPRPSGRDELSEMVTTLNEMLDRLEAAFRAEERFLANAAHELRTPVTHLLSQAQVMLRQRRSPEEYDRFVASVQDEMRYVANVVESLLLLARADAGLPMTGVQVCSLNEALMDAVTRCGPYAAQRETRIVPRLALSESDSDEPEIPGDHELLVSMVANLLRNAVRFSPPEAEVEAVVARVGEEWEISVRDHGPGVPPERLPHLFERFSRYSDTPEGTKGAGLGLSIARSIARIHGGRIDAANVPTGGCRFTVHLPARPVHAGTT